METLGLIDLKQITARNFETFFLKRNPFPPIGIPSETIPFTVNRELEKKRFQDSISELVTSGNSNITVLVGDYGSGKTHMIRLFKQSVNSQLLSVDKGALAVYVKSPGEDFRDFFLSMVDDIGRQLLTNYASAVIRNYLVNNPNEAARYIYDDKSRSSVMKGLCPEDILRNTSYLDLFDALRKTRLQSVKSSDLVNSFLSLAHPDHSSKAWRWLLSERLDKDEKENVGVEDTIDDDEKARSAFGDLVVLLRSVGPAFLVIAVDELEKITLISAAKRGRYQDNLRSIIDEHPSGISFHFAIAPRQWEALTREATALIRRLTGNWQVLKDFDKPITRELIERYLHSARTDHFSSKEAQARFPECEVSLCPFRTDSIDNIQKASGGLASNIILICRRLLEFLHDNPARYKAITPDLVKEVVEREHLERESLVIAS